MTPIAYWTRGTPRFDVVSLVFGATLGPRELALFHISPLFPANY
jgi:hypothetical protein